MMEALYYLLFWRAVKDRDPCGWAWRLCVVVMFLRTAAKHWSRRNRRQAIHNLKRAKSALIEDLC